MERTFYESLEVRRSHYAISNEPILTDDQLEELVKHSVKHTPSAFNSQSSRVVLLLKEEHDKLWEITKEALRKVVPKDQFKPTEDKINAFKAGYGTVLFFEESEIIKGMQKRFTLYKDNFPIWSLESSGMLQFNVWTSLSLAGYGASLQHYNELIEEQVKKEWDLPESWSMRAQMPFGKPTAEPGEKKFSPMETRFKVFK